MSPPASKTAAGSQAFRRETHILLQEISLSVTGRVTQHLQPPKLHFLGLECQSTGKQSLAAVDTSTGAPSQNRLNILVFIDNLQAATMT